VLQFGFPMYNVFCALFRLLVPGGQNVVWGPNSCGCHFRFAGLPGLFAGAKFSFNTSLFFFVSKGDQTFEQLLGFVGIDINCRTNVAVLGRWRVHVIDCVEWPSGDQAQRAHP